MTYTREFLVATFLCPGNTVLICLRLYMPHASRSDEYKSVNNDETNSAAAQTCNANFCIR